MNVIHWIRDVTAAVGGQASHGRNLWGINLSWQSCVTASQPVESCPLAGLLSGHFHHQGGNDHGQENRSTEESNVDVKLMHANRFEMDEYCAF